MININTFIKALHISWLRRIIKQSDNVSWCSVSNINFEKIFNLGSGFIKTLMVNIQNPFWKNILKDWTSFCDCIDIEKTKHILDTPLWYNKKLINGHDFYINQWYRKGIRQVSDLLDDQGNIYDLIFLKTGLVQEGQFWIFNPLLEPETQWSCKRSPDILA